MLMAELAALTVLLVACKAAVTAYGDISAAQYAHTLANQLFAIIAADASIVVTLAAFRTVGTFVIFAAMHTALAVRSLVIAD
jgi:hypothetical protein